MHTKEYPPRIREPGSQFCNFLSTFTGHYPGIVFLLWGRGQPSLWSHRVQASMADMHTARRFLIDLRKADVTTQHLAWQGALYEIANKTWSPQPWYLPVHGPGHPTARGKGLCLPFRFFSSDLFTVSSRGLYYGPGSIRRSRYAPHAS